MQIRGKYKGWKNCIRIENGGIELIATTDKFLLKSFLNTFLIVLKRLTVKKIDISIVCNTIYLSYKFGKQIN